MKIAVGQLRQIIRESIEDSIEMSLLSKIAQTRPRPDASLKPDEQKLVQNLKVKGFVRWDLGSKGWVPTPEGLNALGSR